MQLKAPLFATNGLNSCSMPAIFEYPHTVLGEEIDDQGHVNNLAYLKWMQSAAVAHSAAQGWPPERYREVRAGWVVRSHRIEYLLPAFASQQIVVHTWVADFRKISSLRKYKITRPSDSAVLAVAETNWVFVSLDHRVPRRVPSELIQAFTVVGDDGP
jgi:acyl-CoA thioester hydrolase